MYKFFSLILVQRTCHIHWCSLERCLVTAHLTSVQSGPLSHASMSWLHPHQYSAIQSFTLSRGRAGFYQVLEFHCMFVIESFLNLHLTWLDSKCPKKGLQFSCCLKYRPNRHKTRRSNWHVYWEMVCSHFAQYILSVKWRTAFWQNKLKSPFVICQHKGLRRRNTSFYQKTSDSSSKSWIWWLFIFGYCLPIKWKTPKPGLCLNIKELV